jgi:hypothetical protein
LPSTAYTINGANNAITINSTALLPDDSYTVTLDIYGDVLDSSNSIANWAATALASAGSVNETVKGETYAQAIANGDLGIQKSQQKPSQHGLPTVNVGIMQAALSFANVNANTTLAGTILGNVQADSRAATALTSAPTQVGGWGGAAVFTTGFPSSIGLNYPSASNNGGQDLGPSVAGEVVTNYFFANTGLTASNISTSGTGTGGVFGYITTGNTVAINGLTYAHIQLGTITYTFTTGDAVPTGGTATIVAAGVPTTAGGWNTYWCSGGSLNEWSAGSNDPTATNSNYSLDSVTIAVTTPVSGSSALSFASNSAAAARVLLGNTDLVSFTLANTSATLASSNYGITPNSTGGGAFTPTTIVGPTIGTQSSTSSAFTYNSTGAGLGPTTISLSATDASGSATATSSGMQVDVVQHRALTLANGSNIPANILTNSVWSVGISGPGADTQNTFPVVTSTSYTVNGVTVSGVAGTFTNSTSNQAITLKFAQTGAASGSVTPANLVAGHSVINEETGMGTPSVTGTASYSTNVGSATPAAGGASGLTASFTGTTLSALVAAGATYNNLSAFVNTDLGTIATILTGTNGGTVTGTPSVTMSFRTRATNELPGTATKPPMTSTAGYLASDVVRLSGIGVVNGSQTDAYGLQMTFETSTFSNVATQAAAGYIYLATLNGGSWVNAITGDTTGSGLGNLAQTKVVGAGDTLQAFLNSIGNPSNLNPYVGSWGVDTTGDTAWAIVNHDSDFAVVPEPGTIALLIAGALALPALRRRLKKA